jgi:hypothetical protein
VAELLPCYQGKNEIPKIEIVRQKHIPGKIFFVAKDQPIPGQREYLKTNPKVMLYSQLAFFFSFILEYAGELCPFVL